MYAGSRDAATMALEQYRRIRPADPNALDSLGDVNFYFGQFALAEQFYRQSYEKDSSFNGGGALLKAAHAHLRIGDIPGADALFHQYLSARRGANDPMVELRQAEWKFLSGRRREAVSRLDEFVRSLSTDRAQAMAPQLNAQLAVWALEMGDRTQAREFAQRAQPSRTPGAVSAFVRFLTEPSAPPGEWRQRALRLRPLPLEERARNLMLAYALLMQHEFSAAAPVLFNVYEHSAPEPHEILPILIAWAQLETGHIEDAARFVQRNPIPGAAPELLVTLAFPRLLFLRAVVLEKVGNKSEAVRNFRLFLKLSGPDAQRFGEEERARRAVGGSLTPDDTR
jgi:tetratricopeptide (TPR) repeat protein